MGTLACSRLQRAWDAVFSLRLPKSSTLCLSPAPPRPAPQDLPDCTDQGSGPLDYRLQPPQGLNCSRPQSKLVAFHIIQYTGWANMPRCGMCCLHNPWSPLGTLLPSCDWDVRFNNLSVTLEGIPGHTLANGYTTVKSKATYDAPAALLTCLNKNTMSSTAAMIKA